MSDIRSMSTNDAYRSGWDRIFSKKKEKQECLHEKENAYFMGGSEYEVFCASCGMNQSEYINEKLKRKRKDV